MAVPDGYNSISRDGRIFWRTWEPEEGEERFSTLQVRNDVRPELDYIREKRISRLMVRGADVSPLSECDWLKSIAVSYEYANMDALANLPNLRRLFINSEVSKDVVHLDRFRNVCDLEVFYMSNKIKGVETMTQLECLKLYGYTPKCRSFEALSDMKKLKRASFTYPRIDSVTGIRNWVELNELELCYSRSLSDISELKQCTELRKLLLQAVPHVTDDSFLLEMGFSKSMYNARSPRYYFRDM